MSFNATCLSAALVAAKAAGPRILEIYESTFTVEYKDDRSPLTAADKASHATIVEILGHLGPADLPILSEEGKSITYEARRGWGKFWLVDPLDGTKEFVKKNGEFTVNIALVEGDRPVMGVLFAPVRNRMYFAAEGMGAFLLEGQEIDALPTPAEASGVADSVLEIAMRQARKLPLSACADSEPAGDAENLLKIVGSRSHATEEMEAFLSRQRDQGRKVLMIPAGSAFKFCLVAEGTAHLYPRFGPTMEWDTGAGHIIVLEAGGTLVQAETGAPLIYNKENLLNPWFIARGVSCPSV
jgi:3'(2'), 5'-bisphosphate nucleotidase